MMRLNARLGSFAEKSLEPFMAESFDRAANVNR
jgi:hypothetical protein